MHFSAPCIVIIASARFWALRSQKSKRRNCLLRYTYYYTRRTFSTVRFLFPSSRKSSCLATDIILISSRFQCYSGGAISLARYAWYMQTYVLFQYSILRNIVSKTSESLIRRVINLAFRFVYISHPVAVYTTYVIYVYTALCSLPFQYSVNNVSSINSITLSASRCCSLSNRNDIFLQHYYFTVK